MRRAAARIKPGMATPMVGSGLKQWRRRVRPTSLSAFVASLSWGASLHRKEGASDDARRPQDVLMCSRSASKPLKKSCRVPPRARRTRSFSSRHKPKNSSPNRPRMSAKSTPVKNMHKIINLLNNLLNKNKIDFLKQIRRLIHFNVIIC